MTAAAAATKRLREQEGGYEFTPAGVFACALRLRQERSSGTQAGKVSEKELAELFSTEGERRRVTNVIFKNAIACAEMVPLPAAVFREQKEALNRALADLEASRASQQYQTTLTLTRHLTFGRESFVCSFGRERF